MEQLTPIATPLENGQLTLKYLPKYAHFILTHYVVEFTNEIIRLSHDEEVSYFKNYQSLSEEEYYELNFKSNNRLLEHLGNKNVTAFIHASTDEYMNNRLPVVDKEDILAQDIIINCMIIRKGFRHLLKHYTTDPNYFILVMDDVENFMAAYQVHLFNAYLHIQQKKMKRMNEDLLLAQRLSKMGSFHWDLETNEIKLTDTAMKIFSLNKPLTLEDFFNYLHPDYRNPVKTAIDNAINNDGKYECEYIYAKDGIEKRIYAAGIVNYIDGKPIKMRGSIIDKTTEYNLQQQLKQCEALNKQA